MNRPRPSNQAGPHRPLPAGEIYADELLPLRDALEQLGWGAHSLAAAKRAGLRVLSFGGRSYITGREIIRFLESLPPVERPAAGGRPDLLARRQTTPPDSESGAESPEVPAKASGNGRMLRKTLSDL